jgi:spore maturation protein SpmB
MLLVSLLKLTGILDLLGRITAPFMSLFGLPGEAALVLITGGLVNIYAAIAVAVNVPLTAKGMTVVAIMVLIAHNLIVETAVQSKSGSPASLMLLSRLVAAVLAGLFFSLVIPEGDGQLIAGGLIAGGSGGSVVIANLFSLAKIVVIVVSLVVCVELAREYGLMDRLTAALELPMRAMGIDRKASFVTTVGLLLGLAYGAGLIVDEARRNSISSREILAANIFLGTNHALIEDSLIFAAVGASLPWIVLGRLAFGAVYQRLAVPVAARLAKYYAPADQ